MKTLAEINDILGAEAAADLTAIIADVKAAVRSSDAGVIADRDAEIAKLKADSADALAAQIAKADEAAKLAKAEADAALAKSQSDAAAGQQTAAVALQDAKDAAAIALLQATKAGDDAVAVVKSELATVSANASAEIAHLQGALSDANASATAATQLRDATLRAIADKGNALRSHLTLALAIADEALKDDDARQAEEVAARKAELQRQIDALK